MSILNVEHLTHGFGDRAIFEDVSFRLLKGEHIGLVGANGEGKSTFMSIVTGKLMPDEGKVEWAKNVRTGYLDQNSTLQKGMTIESVLKSAFAWLFEQEERMNEICDQLGSADPDQMDAMMEELGGGGHQTVAGVQLDNKRAVDIMPQIISLAKKQLEEIDNNESDLIAGCKGSREKRRNCQCKRRLCKEFYFA